MVNTTHPVEKRFMAASRITKRLSLLLLLTSILYKAHAQQDISLNGEWQFWIPDCEESASIAPQFKAPVMVVVPHTYNVMEGLEDYAGRACYKRPLPITLDMKGKLVRLHFNAVYHDAIIYINDQKVGEHLNAGYSPFSFDITPYINLAPGATNELRVECSNHYTDKNLPWLRKFDWANDGGIYRDVKLHVSGRQSIRYVHVTPDINLTDSTAQALISMRLWQPSVKKVRLTLRLLENKSGNTIYQGTHTLKVTPKGTFECNVDCGKIHLWHFDNPALYRYEVCLTDGQQIMDSRTECFGFRTFKIEGDHFTLNGESVRLPGIENMPGSNPDFGMAESHDYMAKTVALMKDLNTTITRYHWAQDDYRYHLMDSLGMLVQEEISWWGEPVKQLGDTLLATAKSQLTELIEAHYNHPSIFAWGMSNEVYGNHQDALEMANLTRELDSTRIVDVVSNGLNSNLEKDPSVALDLPTWNDYAGTWHGPDRTQLPGFLQAIGKALPGRPLFITEHGLCEPRFTGGDARRIDEMIYHIHEWQKQPFICGYIYFCLEDYRTQMGEEGEGKDRIRRHGVCNKRLEPKASYHVLKQLMNPVEVISVTPGEQPHSAAITIRVKQDIPCYTLKGYKIVYADGQKAQRTIPLPDLRPGDQHAFVMPNVNKSYNFTVCRADGSIVHTY